MLSLLYGLFLPSLINFKSSKNRAKKILSFKKFELAYALSLFRWISRIRCFRTFYVCFTHSVLWSVLRSVSINLINFESFKNRFKKILSFEIEHAYSLLFEWFHPLRCVWYEMNIDFILFVNKMKFTKNWIYKWILMFCIIYTKISIVICKWIFYLVWLKN